MRHSGTAAKTAAFRSNSEHRVLQSLNLLRNVEDKNSLIEFLYKKIEILESERVENMRFLAQNSKSQTSESYKLRQELYDKKEEIKQLNSDLNNLKDCLLQSEDSNVKLAAKYDDCRLELCECKRKMQQLILLMSKDLQDECTYVRPKNKSQREKSMLRSKSGDKGVEKGKKGDANKIKDGAEHVDEFENIRICYLPCDESEALKDRIKILEMQLHRMTEYCENLDYRVSGENLTNAQKNIKDKNVYHNMYNNKVDDFTSFTSAQVNLQKMINELKTELQVAKDECLEWKQSYDSLQLAVASERAYSFSKQ